MENVIKTQIIITKQQNTLIYYITVKQNVAWLA